MQYKTGKKYSKNYSNGLLNECVFLKFSTAKCKGKIIVFVIVIVVIIGIVIVIVVIIVIAIFSCFLI